MTASSDFNLQRLNTKEFFDMTRATIDFGGNILAVARRGTGKTMIAKQAVASSGSKELYLNLSTMERPDIGGYPNFFAAANAGKEKVSYIDSLMPNWYQPLFEGNQPVVAILDEVDKADPSLYAPLLEFTQFHSINGRKMNNLQAIIMTSNLVGEGSQRPCLPLLDRAEKYLVEASYQQWLDWASKDGSIHPSITAYIADHPEDLHGDTDPGDVWADQSPRSWHNSSNIVKFGEEKKWPAKMLTAKVAGCIGKKTGIKYSAYFEHYQVLLPIIEKIMKGEKVKDFSNLEQSKQLVACMITCSRLSRLLDEAKPGTTPKESDIVASFFEQMDPEISLISIRSQIGLNRVLKHDLMDNTKWGSILGNIVKRIEG